jgi:uncharacterized protein YggE
MLKELKIPFFVIFFLFLGLYLFTNFVGPIPFSVNSVTTAKANLFTVQGTGEVTAIPDTAELNLGVEKDANTVVAAQEQVNAIINNLTKDLKALGIDSKAIKTTSYSVNPNYDYNGSSQRITGYNVNANISVKVKPIDKANQAIDIATRDGATNVGSIQFVVDDAKQKELEDQARKEAIDAAKTKAASISKAAGIRLGKIVDVQEDGTNNYPRPVYTTMMAKDAAGTAPSEPTQLNPGENKITSNVSISYETY